MRAAMQLQLRFQCAPAEQHSCIRLHCTAFCSMRRTYPVLQEAAGAESRQLQVPRRPAGGPAAAAGRGGRLDRPAAAQPGGPLRRPGEGPPAEQCCKADPPGLQGRAPPACTGCHGQRHHALPSPIKAVRVVTECMHGAMSVRSAGSCDAEVCSNAAGGSRLQDSSR